jgi:hypothetical protein
VAVPWSLLKSSESGAASLSSSSASTAGAQQSFTISVDRSKLDQAPSLTQATMSQITQADWRQRVYTHFGVSSTATGGAESPSGATQGSGAQQLQDKPSSSSGSE